MEENGYILRERGKKREDWGNGEIFLLKHGSSGEIVLTICFKPFFKFHLNVHYVFINVQPWTGLFPGLEIQG